MTLLKLHTKFKDLNNSCSFPDDWETIKTERELDNICNSFDKAIRLTDNFVMVLMGNSSKPVPLELFSLFMMFLTWLLMKSLGQRC